MDGDSITWPAPSAMQMVACPFWARRCSRYANSPFWPSIANFTSGIRQTSTVPAAIEACIKISGIRMMMMMVMNIYDSHLAPPDLRWSWILTCTDSDHGSSLSTSWWAMKLTMPLLLIWINAMVGWKRLRQVKVRNCQQFSLGDWLDTGTISFVNLDCFGSKLFLIANTYNQSRLFVHVWGKQIESWI